MIGTGWNRGLEQGTGFSFHLWWNEKPVPCSSPLFHHALYRRPPAAVNAAWTPWNAMATSAATPV